MVHALALAAQGQPAAALAARQRALDAAPAVPGRLVVAERSGDGTGERQHAFAWLADADSRLGPLLEMIVNGKYFWVPATAVRTLRIDAPTDLRDLVWLPATVRWQNGGEAIALLPARYPGSEAAADASLRLGQRTEWLDQGHDTFFGLGQRVLTTDTGDHGLLDVRQVAFDAA
jgi:type VI secretion system protein ImpE